MLTERGIENLLDGTDRRLYKTCQEKGIQFIWPKTPNRGSVGEDVNPKTIRRSHLRVLFKRSRESVGGRKGIRVSDSENSLDGNDRRLSTDYLKVVA